MEQLYCPWRETYSSSVSGTKRENVSADECAFCTKCKQSDDTKNFIVKRFPHCAVLLNLYPYNAGHLLVIPYRHAACLSELSEDERNELMAVLTLTIDIAKQTLEAQGINIGLNLGRAAGAGIPSHLHFHVLPRWVGDTNFMPLLAQTKTVSFDLHNMHEKLHKAFAKFDLPSKQR